MAVTYKGLTIKFGGDTTELQGALKSVQSSGEGHSGALKDINRALKFDPGNTDLLVERKSFSTAPTARRKPSSMRTKPRLRRSTRRSAAARRSPSARKRSIRALSSNRHL